MKNLLKKYLLIAFLTAVAYGCAAPPMPDIIWPKPPDEPRVKFVKHFYGLNDFKKGSVAMDIVLGSEAATILVKPMGIHVTETGKIYVTDTAHANIFVFDPVNSNAKLLLDAGAKLLYKPVGVAVDRNNRIFVADSQADLVAVFDEDGKYLTTVSPSPALKQPSGIAIDHERNRLYVADTHTHDIRIIDLTTLKQINSFGKRGKEEGSFNFPSHIAIGPNGFLYITDTMNARVQIFDQDGKFIRSFGEFGDSPGTFARPKGIGIDSEGHIYVVDAAFNNIQIFNDEGQVLMAFSEYGMDRGQMILPSGLTIDKDDYIYVADSWNQRILQFEFLGEKHRARNPKTAK